MNGREQSLEERRLELVQRSAAQRAALVADAGPLIHAASVVDGITAPVRRYPALLALAAGAVALVGRGRLFSLATQALTLYSILRRR